MDAPLLSTWVLLGLLALGVFLLVWGARWVTDASVALALRLGVQPLVIGLTIVALATSLPELVSSLYAAWAGAYGLVMGNIVGSNLCNIGLVLGLAGVITPIEVHMQLLRREIPLLTLLTLGFCAMAYWGGLNHLEGWILVVGGIAYFAWLVKTSKGESREVLKEYTESLESPALQKLRDVSLLNLIVLIALGSLMLYFGSQWAVESSVSLAVRFGLSEFWIGMTVVALGTSLPELVTSIVACLRGHGDLCVGNVVGSNLVNILFVGGGVGGLFALPVPQDGFLLELGILAAMTALMWIFLKTERFLVRWEGIALLSGYFLVLVLTG